MALFQWTLALLLVAVLLSAVARRIGAPYPAFLALAGAGLAFLPFAPDIAIDPELALALFVAPVLLDAGFDTSPRDLKRHALPIASLVFVAVGLTTAAVALVGWTMAGLPVAAAIALGAIVAPPDAAAAAAVLEQVPPPRRIFATLQGESLLNDATALLVYKMAVLAATGSLALSTIAPAVVLSAAGSLVVGYALARAYLAATMRLRDPASGTVLQFVSTFGVWLLADQIGLSAIVTMVVYAMTLGRLAPGRMPARNRVSSYSVWETVVFVLNVLAFMLMGLQARPILARLSGDARIEALWLAAAVLATVIVVRLAWAFVYGATARAARRRRGPDGSEMKYDRRADLLIGWCGMRGLITLAASFALPAGFPGRDQIVLTAFCVVLGTLVIQGLTLKPLLARLAFDQDTSVDGEVSRGRTGMLDDAIDSLDGRSSDAAAALRAQYLAMRAVAENPAAPQAATEFDVLRLAAISRQRAALDRLRADGTIGDEAYHRLEEELDWAEMDAAPAGRFQPLTT